MTCNGLYHDFCLFDVNFWAKPSVRVGEVVQQLFKMLTGLADHCIVISAQVMKHKKSVGGQTPPTVINGETVATVDWKMVSIIPSCNPFTWETK